MNQLGQDNEPSPCGCAHKHTLKHYSICHQQCECYHQPEMNKENINRKQEITKLKSFLKPIIKVLNVYVEIL